MKNLNFTIVFVLTFLLASCSYKIKDKYNCNCKEEATEFKRVTYDELVAKWGNPSEKESDLEHGIYTAIWEKHDFFKDVKKIQMEFNVSSYDIEPHGHPNKIWCEGQPYMGATEMVTGWTGPY